MIIRNTRIKLLPKRFVLTLAFLLGSVIASLAQTVAVTNGHGENGFGWMFRYGGTCYAVMPAHVAGELPRVTITSAAPVLNGSGAVIRPFWPGLDLALAVVRGGVEARCSEGLDRLDLSRDARSAAGALLLRLGPTGEEERVPVAVIRRDYLTLEAEVSVGGAEIYQGTSGAFAFAGDEPIGMAITSESVGSLVLMRSEEIAVNVGRYLSEQGATFAAAIAPPTTSAQEEGIALQLMSVSAPPVAPQFGSENLFGNGFYVFSPQRNMEILMRTAGDGPVALSRLSIAAPVDPTYAMPRNVIIMTDAGEAGNRFLTWTRGEVAPDGIFDTGFRAPRNVRWIKILILDTWKAGNVAISSIAAQ